MEEVVTIWVVANPGRPSAADRSHVEVPVIGGEVDQPALRVEDVVVVDRRKIVDHDLLKRHLWPEVQPPQQPMAVEQQGIAVKSPVGGLE